MNNFHYPSPTGLLLVLGLFVIGCSSPKAPQAACDCLTKEADAYLAQHPGLTTAQLGEAMTAIAAPCQALADEAERQLKSADADTQAKARAQVQACLDALGQKMKAAAKDDAATKAPAAAAADDQAAAAEAKADQLAADLEAGRTPAPASSEELSEEAAPAGGRVSETAWDKMLADYSAYTDQYAALMRKGAKGDMSALSDAADLQVKAQELEAQLKAYAGKATLAQNTRFAKVQARAMQTMLQAQQ